MIEGVTAEIGLLGGTGLYGVEGLTEVKDLDVETPYGAPSSTIRTGVLEGRRVAFIARHGPGHTLLPSEIPYRANIYALKLLGVSKLLSAGAVGSLREELPPRTLVIPNQFLDRTRHRQDTFFGDGLVVHVSMADPFSEDLRAALLEGAADTGHAPQFGGTYLCMEGPQFSTRAESMFYRDLDCDIIGMTNITEARLAREAEIAFAALSLVTDYDAWRPHAGGVDTAEILAVLRDNAHVAEEVLHAAVKHIPEGQLPENRVLEMSIVTQLDKVPDATKSRLAAILGPYL